MTDKRSRGNLAFDPSRAALLVIDLQNFFAHKDGRAYLSASNAVVPNIKKLIGSFNSKKMPVIATIHCHSSQNNLGVFGKFYNDYIKQGEWDSLLIDEIKNDVPKIIQKDRYDAFWRTELDAELKKLNVDQIVITGCMTHLCCETTARSAFVRDYEVYFVADGTFTKNETLHTGTLNNVADGFGIVTSTQEVIELCEAKL